MLGAGLVEENNRPIPQLRLQYLNGVAYLSDERDIKDDCACDCNHGNA